MSRGRAIATDGGSEATDDGSEATTDDGSEAGNAGEEFDAEQLVEHLSKIDEFLAEFKEALVGGESESGVLELAEDLWEVLDEVEDVLETIDLEEVPEAIDVADLPEAVDVEEIPEGLFDEDQNAVELTSVREAVDLRELWEAVDLTQLYQEKQELEDEVDDVTDHVEDEEDEEDGSLVDAALGGDDGGLIGDDEDDGDDELFEDVVGVGEGAHVQFDAEARQAVLEEKIHDAVVKFREVLLSTHSNLRKLYRMNQEKLGQPDRQPNSLNPTAVSTLPPGPVPKSASLRASTVPAQVRYSRVDNPRRIYAHRFDEATDSDTKEENTDDVDEADEEQPDEKADEADGEQSDSEDPSEGNEEEEEIVIEVYDE